MKAKTAIIISIIISFVFVLGLSLSYYLGIFNKVKLEQKERGCYQVVYLPHKGKYSKIYDKIKKVKAWLKTKKAKMINPCAIYYDDPAKVPENMLRSKGGYIVDFRVKLEPPFEQEHIPKRDVLLATFQGHPIIASFKIYPQMNKWMNKNNFEPDGYIIEIYKSDGCIECEMPIKPKGGKGS